MFIPSLHQWQELHPPLRPCQLTWRSVGASAVTTLATSPATPVAQLLSTATQSNTGKIYWQFMLIHFLKRYQTLSNLSNRFNTIQYWTSNGISSISIYFHPRSSEMLWDAPLWGICCASLTSTSRTGALCLWDFSEAFPDTHWLQRIATYCNVLQRIATLQ